MWMDSVSWVLRPPSLALQANLWQPLRWELHTESTAVCRGKEQDDVKGWWWVSSWTSRIVSPAACRAQQSREQAAWPRQSVLDSALFWIHKDLSYASNHLLSLHCRFMLHRERRQGPAVYYWGCVFVTIHVCVCVCALRRRRAFNLCVCWRVCSGCVCLVCVWWGA